MHGSVSIDALQRKEAEESACGQVHDPAFKISDFGNVNAQFRRYIPGVTRRSLMQSEFHIRK